MSVKSGFCSDSARQKAIPRILVIVYEVLIYGKTLVNQKYGKVLINAGTCTNSVLDLHVVLLNRR